MPKNDQWIEALFHDTQGNRFLLPHHVSADSVATLALEPPSLGNQTPYETLQTRLVKPKSLDHISPSHLTGQRLQWMLFNFIRSDQQPELSATLLTWQAQDLPFRELVFFILCLAIGGQYLALVDQRRVIDPCGKGLYLRMLTDNDLGGYNEFATSLGVGYHMDGLPMGSAPHETKYWLQEALICLVPRLNCPGILEKAIVDAIEYGRADCTRNSFNAVLMSIEHLVLIKSYSDGNIDHTELLPLMSISTHVSKDSRARYGDQALDTFYNAVFTQDSQEDDQSKEMDVEQLSQHSKQQDCKNDDDCDDDRDEMNEEQDPEENIKDKSMEDGHEEVRVENEEAEEDSETTHNSEEDARMVDEGSEEKVAVVQPPQQQVTNASIKKSFMSLIQFFEATTLETLRLTQPNEARLPEEICEMVLRNVSDVKTYESCLKVSRRFRQICQRRPLIMDNVAFLEPLPDNPASLTTKEEDEVTQDPPDFLALEVSSDRQMNVWLRSRGGGSDALECLIVAGRESNRKTYVVGRAIVFLGLRVPAPEIDTASKSETRDEW